MQIITGSQPGPGQSHGCPFRHYSETNLSAALSTTYRLSSLDQKEILAAVKNKHFHVACTRLFEIQHASNGVVKGEGLGKGDMVDHPNKFFERSRKVIMGETDDDQVKAEGGVNSDKGAKMEVDT
jgi:DNA primase large subunit